MTTRLRLQQVVDAWLARDDVAVTGADFDIILALAESEIATEVRCVVQEQVVTVNFTGYSADLPYNYNGLRNIFNAASPSDKIEYMTPEAIRQSPGWVNGRVGSFYTIEGGDQTAGDERVQLTISGPASASAPLNLEVLYWARFAALTNDSDTNWLLANHFNVYLYATLRAAAEYAEAGQNETLEDRYKAKFDDAVTRLNKNENRKRFGANAKQASSPPRSVI